MMATNITQTVVGGEAGNGGEGTKWAASLMRNDKSGGTSHRRTVYSRAPRRNARYIRESLEFDGILKLN
jgi:hypothetical protein